MKPRIILPLILLFASVSAFVSVFAQKRMAVGDKTAGITATEWLKGFSPSNVPVYINFFSLNSAQSKDEMQQFEHFAAAYKDKIAFVLITKDEKEKMKGYLEGTAPSYSVALDGNGQTFGDYGVMYVPFGVLIDAKGRFVWQGKTSQLNDQILEKALK